MDANSGPVPSTGQNPTVEFKETAKELLYQAPQAGASPGEGQAMG